MADGDITQRLLMSHNDVFADIVNGWFTLRGGGKPFRRVADAVLKFLAASTGDRAFETAQTLIKQGERVTMIDVWTRMLAENREKDITLGREHGITLGREQGITLGREQLLLSLVGDGLLPLDVAAARANLSEAEFRARLEQAEGTTN